MTLRLSLMQSMKEKTDKLDFIKILKFCASVNQEHYPESEKTTHRMDQNICKSCIQYDSRY